MVSPVDLAEARAALDLPLKDDLAYFGTAIYQTDADGNITRVFSYREVFEAENAWSVLLT